MIRFEAEIERFERKGEKSGWTYVSIPATIACLIKPDCRKSFRVKGWLDQLEIKGLAVLPMGEGDFILALKSTVRKALHKEAGANLVLQLAEDTTFEILMPEDLELCLSDEQALLEQFLRQPKSHQNYFINWLNSAKTENTRVKRLSLIVMAMDQKLNYGEMIRASSAKDRI